MEEEDIFGVDEDGVLTVRDLWRCLFKLIDVILQKSKQLDMIILFLIVAGVCVLIMK